MNPGIVCSQEEVVELGRGGDDGGTLRKAEKNNVESSGPAKRVL